MSALAYFSLILLFLLLAISIKARELRPLVSFITAGLVMYVGLKSNSRDVLLVSVANLNLFLGASLLNVHRNIFGLSDANIKNRGALISIPYLFVMITISFSKCSICYLSILLWVVLWYYFKNKCKNLNRMCIMLLYLPIVILA
ncbi:hypothetical protein, partial [Thermococcus sp. GR7]